MLVSGVLYNMIYLELMALYISFSEAIRNVLRERYRRSHQGRSRALLLDEF